ncbi:hypothetical protein K438DRAFT_1756813 [Mycena galopus ATCC 62051]|nr:hypothetical protein K438DRAFT_1756813 [Mycena galopus ATCC 62051]
MGWSEIGEVSMANVTSAKSTHPYTATIMDLHPNNLDAYKTLNACQLKSLFFSSPALDGHSLNFLNFGWFFISTAVVFRNLCPARLRSTPYPPSFSSLFSGVIRMPHTVNASSDNLLDKDTGIVDKTSRRSLKEPRIMFIMAIGLHIGLVLIHLAFVLIHFPNKYETRLSVPLGPRSNALSVVIIVVSQVFAVSQVYLAALVYFMQQLSLRRNLDIQQPLTAFHDKHAAWSGPGSALTTLWRGRHGAFSGLALIGLYVFGASALHITTPSLVSLATSNKTSAGFADLNSARPYYFDPEVDPEILSDAVSVLPALSLLQAVNVTAGLYGNILYDTPTSIVQAYWPFEDRPPAKEFSVPNATVFNVTCGNLAGVEQVGPGNATSWFLKTPVRNVTDGHYNPLRAFTPYGIRFIPQEYTVEQYIAASQTLLLVASVNITDSRGQNGSTFAVNPAFNPLPFDWIDPDSGISIARGRPGTFDPVVIACSLVSASLDVTIDPTSKTIAQSSIDANPRKTYRVWSSWTEPPQSNDVLVQSWASIFLDATLSPVIATTCDDPNSYPNSNNSCQGTQDYLTIVEKYVNDRLGIRPVSQNNPDQDSDYTNSTVNLHDLENVLEDLTAAVFWSDANLPGSRQLTDVVGGVNVTIYDPNAQLTINETPLIAGFVCSLGLLCLALNLVKWPQDTSTAADLDLVGLLQFTWLLGKGSNTQNNIASVTRPSTNNLRAAGMTEITLSTLACRAHGKDRGDEES